MARLCPNSIWNISKLMVAWTISTPYNSRLDDYCMPIIKRVSQAPFCGNIKKVTDKDEDIAASFAPLELLNSSLFVALPEMTCSFVKTVFRQLL
jgi:hypothetical protein